jgi:hypothetical protein
MKQLLLPIRGDEVILSSPAGWNQEEEMQSLCTKPLRQVEDGQCLALVPIGNCEVDLKIDPAPQASIPLGFSKLPDHGCTRL